MQKITQFELSKLIIQSKLFSKIKLTASARLVLIVLCSHYPNIYPSIKTIQEEAGISSKQSVFNSLKELSSKGLILYETKKSNIYTLTGLFFELIAVQKLDTNKKNNNKKNNKPFFKISESSIPLTVKKSDSRLTDFKKNDLPKYHSNCHITGINIPKYIPEEIKRETPLDMTKEQAIEFLNNLPKPLQNSFFAVELRKKWG